MKTLKNHLILFDAECPMCRAYTQAFTHTGMLDRNGRASYQQPPEAVCPLIDRHRAVNEIALVDTETGEVSYGIYSLFKILGNAWPVFKPVFGLKPFGWVMSKVYAFISYNRRVIIPASAHDTGIQPDFKLHYRIAYLLFTWLATGFLLTSYARLLQPMVPAGHSWREYAICGGQLIWQAMVVGLLMRRNVWNYLGNMMTVSFAGGLLLTIGMGVNKAIALPPIITTIYFLCVAGLMFMEHARRCKLLQLGWLPTITWVFYRVILLGLILKLGL